MIIDTHIHSYFPQIQKDWEAVLDSCRHAGVTHQIQIGVDEISTMAALKLAQENSGMYATIGLHPCDVDQVGVYNPDYHRYDGLRDYRPQTTDLDSFFMWLEDRYLENQDQVVGFGETGFDLYHRDTPELLEIQTQSFHRHVDLCEKYGKTLVIHNRNSQAVCLDFLTKRLGAQKPNFKTIIHCFAEDAAYAQIMTERFGFFLGIGGTVTYPKNTHIQEAVKATPIEFLVTETDGPFLPPHPQRQKGIKTNISAYIPEVITKIAELKNMDRAECEAILFENGKRAFGI